MAKRFKSITSVGKGFSRYMGSISRKKRKDDRMIGLLIDGPNILRKEFDINLDDIKKILEDMGDIRIGKVLLNQFAPHGLIEAIANQGFDAIVVTGDIDVRMGVEAMDIIYNDNINTVAIATRDADFVPILAKAKEHGKETIVIGAEPGFSIALQNTSDFVIKMGKIPPDAVEEDEEQLRIEGEELEDSY
ncbi:MAG: NYN domain protein [Euryarchaeota archaeon ADurb.Bin023]|jgi:uncharacterized protein (TIGR00288 family)|nr:TIGR00288 family NYN domain-containing protein [Candidatus Methanofastidiosa archaeon]OQC50908.1 MAG: NYN domain protein [Euryarchaeota archaeon ADurb.Bin023]